VALPTPKRDSGFFFQPQRNNSSGTTADGNSNSEAGGGAVEAQQTAAGNSSTARPMAARWQPIRTKVFRPPGLGMRLRGSQGKRDKYS
jgi:hypothetical protein